RGGQALRPLAVESPERVGVEPLPVLGAQLVPPVREVGTKELEVAGAADLVPHRIEPEDVGGQGQRAEEPVGEGDDLDVEVRVGRAEGLDPQLVMLAVAAGLWAFVPAGRCGLPGLPRQGWAVLDEGPDDRGG